MATCTCVIYLISISHTGDNIGDDWSYIVTVNGQSLPINNRGAGFPGNLIQLNHRWIFSDKKCGAIVTVPVSIRAEEEDLFFDDVGSRSVDFSFNCPPPGGGPLFIGNLPLRIIVQERPRFLRGVSTVTFTFDILTFCS